jgi:membrane-associated phospholipid phosphatase
VVLAGAGSGRLAPSRARVTPLTRLEGVSGESAYGSNMRPDGARPILVDWFRAAEQRVAERISAFPAPAVTLAGPTLGSSLALVVVYVPYAATFGEIRHVAEALATFGGLLMTGIAASLSQPARPLGRFVQAAWPVAWWPVLYPQAVAVIELDRSRFLDPVLFRIDAALFGWSGGVPSPTLLGGPLEELANAFYVSYYVGIPLGFLLIWRRSVPHAVRYGSAILVAFATCAVLWLAFPSGGLHPSGGPTTPAWGPFTAFARQVYETNPHYAAAFPSSHVALAFAAASAMLRVDRKALWAIVWAVGVALATVIGQYHYTVDAVGGAVVGAWAAAVAFAGVHGSD